MLDSDLDSRIGTLVGQRTLAGGGTTRAEREQTCDWYGHPLLEPWIEIDGRWYHRKCAAEYEESKDQ
jgi:hypothetical protein